MDKTAMLYALISHFSGGKKSAFAAHLGVSPQAISSWLTRKTFDAELIYSKCVGVSASWLLSGKGSMLHERAIRTYTDSPNFEPAIYMVRQTSAEYNVERSTKEPIHDDSAVSLALIAQYNTMQERITTQAEEIGRLKAENDRLKEECINAQRGEKGQSTIDGYAVTA